MSHDEHRSGLSRRDVIQRGGAVTLPLGAAQVLAACGGPSGGSNGQPGATTTPSGGPPTAGTPVRGGTIKIGWVGSGTETVIPGPGVAHSATSRLGRLFP